MNIQAKVKFSKAIISILGCICAIHIVTMLCEHDKVSSSIFFCFSQVSTQTYYCYIIIE